MQKKSNNVYILFHDVCFWLNILTQIDHQWISSLRVLFKHLLRSSFVSLACPLHPLNSTICFPFIRRHSLLYTIQSLYGFCVQRIDVYVCIELINISMNFDWNANLIRLSVCVCVCVGVVNCSRSLINWRCSQLIGIVFWCPKILQIACQNKTNRRNQFDWNRCQYRAHVIFSFISIRCWNWCRCEQTTFNDVNSDQVFRI